jgi:hypothetical protein
MDGYKVEPIRSTRRRRYCVRSSPLRVTTEPCPSLSSHLLSVSPFELTNTTTARLRAGISNTSVENPGNPPFFDRTAGTSLAMWASGECDRRCCYVSAPPVGDRETSDGVIRVDHSSCFCTRAAAAHDAYLRWGAVATTRNFQCDPAQPAYLR